MADEPGRGHAVFDSLPPLATVTRLALVGVAVGTVATVVNPRGATYVVAAVFGGFAGAVTEDLFAGRYRTVDGVVSGLPTAVRRALVALVVTAATTLASLVVAIESGVPSAILPAVLAVTGLAWLGGVGLRRVLSPPVTFARLRARVDRVDRPTWYVLGFATVLFVGFTAFTTWLYTVFWMGGSDFGAYVHMFATTLDGEGLLLHGKYRVSQPRGSYWGGHFSLTLFAFLPLFALVPSPITLLVAKSALVAASVPLLWILAREHVGDDVAGLVTASYGLNPFLWSAWVFDFQEQALLPTLVFGAFLAYRRDHRGVFVVLTTLACLTNEFAIIVLLGALVGTVVAAARAGDLRERAPTLGVTVGLAVLSFALAVVVTTRFSVNVGIPYASFAEPFKPYLDTRTGAVELLVTVAGDPGLLAESFTIDVTPKLLYFIALFAGVVFLGLNDEVSVGAVVPYLGFAWFFAGRPIYHMFGAHYPFYLLPFIYIGTVRILGRIDLPRPSRDLLKRLLVTIILVNVFASFAVGADHGVFPPPTDPQHNDVVETAIEGIPEEATLLTQNDVYPHVATRPHATYVGRPDMFRMYQEAHGKVSPEYLLLDGAAVTRENDWSTAVEEGFGDRLGTEYGLYRCEDGVAVYRRGYDGAPQGITRSQPGQC